MIEPFKDHRVICKLFLEFSLESTQHLEVFVGLYKGCVIELLHFLVVLHKQPQVFGFVVELELGESNFKLLAMGELEVCGDLLFKHCH